MVKPSVITHAIIEPIAAFVTMVLVVWQLVIDRTLIPVDIAIVVVSISALVVRRVLRRQQLLSLIGMPPQPVRKLTPVAFGVRESGNAVSSDDVTSQTNEELAEYLGERRLVLLCGERLSGRRRAGFAALTGSYDDYIVLLPRLAPEIDPGRPPLTSLLTSGILSVRKRYVLWLDDIGALMQAGFDPRIVERWLAAGSGRVALGTITPADLRRIKAARTSEGFALERAACVSIEAPPQLPHVLPATGSDDWTLQSESQAARFLRIVAAADLLRLPNQSDDVFLSVLRQVTGAGLPQSSIDQLCSAPSAPLRRRESDNTLSARPELLATIEAQLLTRDEDWPIVNAFTETLDASALVALGRALADRRYLIQAEDVLGRAKQLGEKARHDDIKPAVTRAFVAVVARKAGRPSGANLSNAGGLDFSEVMGPAQREAAKRLLPKQSDGDFDPSLPPEPEDERASTRFYRRRLHRAVARTAFLVLIDVIAITVAAAAALAVRADARHQHVRVVDPDLWKLVLAGATLTILVAVWLGLYRADTARARIHLILATMTVLTIAVAAGFFVAGVDFGSLTALVVLFLVAVGVDGLLRWGYDVASWRWVRARRLQSRVLIMGRKHEARSYAKNVKERSARPVQPVAFLSPVPDHDPFCVGTYRLLTSRLQDLHIAELVVADRTLSSDDKAQYVAIAQTLGVDVRYVANDREIVLGAVGRVGDYGFVHVPAALITPERLEIKRLFDHVVLALTVPIWGAVILLYAAYSRVRRPGQPVFVTADRVGLGETGYSLVRLRTRTYHPDHTRGKLPTGRVEAWFERKGLDELPQVINVLRDEMSIVGPRPLAARDVADLNPDQRRSLGARPGMTGRWQVIWLHGASEAEMRAIDADYLRRWRLFHDVELILRTPMTIVRRRTYLGDTELRRRRERVGDPSAKTSVL